MRLFESCQYKTRVETLDLEIIYARLMLQIRKSSTLPPIRSPTPGANSDNAAQDAIVGAKRKRHPLRVASFFSLRPSVR